MKRKPKRTQRPVSTRTDKGYSVAKAGGLRIESYQVGALPILNEIIRRTRLEHFLTSYLRPDPREKIASPRALIILLKNVLLSRRPVYGIGEWAEQQARDLLGITAQQIEALNDDRIGRCLDRVFAADYPSLLIALVSHVVKEFDLNLDELHNDSTTITFHGRYPDATAASKVFGKETLAITWGHNKDHRPDLKQLLFILTVASDGGVPIHFKPCDGNTEDSTTHRETWDLLHRLAGRADFLYVADSKLATSATMEYLDRQGGRFVSVLPRTRKEDTDFRDRLVSDPDQSTWVEIHRKTKEVQHGDKKEVILLDLFRQVGRPASTAEGFRLMWFHSSRKQELDALARTDCIDRALKKLGELRQRLHSPRTRFRRREKVAQAVQDLLQEVGAERWLLVEIKEREVARYHQAGPGRPGPNTKYNKQVRIRFDLAYEIDTAKVATDSRTDGVFPLVTNDPQLSALEVLLAYKRQPQVEKRFSRLKTDFEVAPVYLKSVARVEGLLCVYFLALLVEALLERELRSQMAAAGRPYLRMYPERRKCKLPSTRRLIDVFNNIERLVVHDQGKLRANLVTDLSSVQKEILDLLGIRRSAYRPPAS